MEPIKKITILGGGTAGWMTAAALCKAFKPETCEIRLIESEEIGIVGVGEATLPHVRDFNEFLGIDEAEFMRETNATFKLGIEFCGWGRDQKSYIHPFGVHGQTIEGQPFLPCWIRARQEGDATSIEDYSLAIAMARNLRFDFPSSDAESIRSTYSYAYHFDAVLYSRYLRKWAQGRGVMRIEGKVVEVLQRPEDGFVRALKLENGTDIDGDVFIDCSGFRALINGDCLKSEWEDWTPWLPCDRALAVPSERAGDLTPFTRAVAQEAGWTWRIPLQHRTGNGYVFSSQFTTLDKAEQVLLSGLDGRAQAQPRLLKFSAGRRQRSWVKNCVAVGLASGFLEPLESTSIYLAQMAITFLLKLMPDKDFEPNLSREFNRLIDIEYERVRDFLILHYHANMQTQGEMWDYVRAMNIPQSLAEKLALYRHRGHITRYKDGLFSPASWIAVYTGQDIYPENYDRQVEAISADILRARLQEIRGSVVAQLSLMPRHDEFMASYCRNNSSASANAFTHG